MAVIRRVEDIQAWQKASVLVRAIYEVSDQRALLKDYALRDQLRRSAISVISNIAEGFGRRTSKEFINFLSIAHGSVAELQSQLYVTLDLGYVSKPRFTELYNLAEEISKMTQSLMSYLQSNSQLATPNSQLRR